MMVRPAVIRWWASHRGSHRGYGAVVYRIGVTGAQSAGPALVTGQLLAAHAGAVRRSSGHVQAQGQGQARLRRAVRSDPLRL